MSVKYVEITNLQLQDLIPYDKVFDKLSPLVQGNKLNSYLYYKANEDRCYLIIKDSQAYSVLIINSTIIHDPDIESMAFMINYNTLYEILSEYSSEELQSVKISFGLGKNTTYFKINSNTDRLQLPHSIVPDFELKDLDLMIDDFSIDNINSIDIRFNEENLPIFNGIIECLNFIGNDDTKNNALALYPDKVITNDRRHIYQYNLNNNITTNDPIILHKNAAKIINTLIKNKVLFTLEISKDNSRILLFNNNFICNLNNQISNIKPPTQEILKDLASSKIVASVSKELLFNILSLFSNFYTSSNEFNSLKINYSNNNLKFILRDTSTASSTSCDIERNIETLVNDIVFDVEDSIIYDSIISFLTLLDSNNIIDIYDSSEFPALKLVSGFRSIYLAKLGWQPTKK
jgi:hypothetical protein